MLALVIKSLLESKNGSRLYGTIMDVEHQAKRITDPTLRDEIIGQCRVLLDTVDGRSSLST